MHSKRRITKRTRLDPRPAIDLSRFHAMPLPCPWCKEQSRVLDHGEGCERCILCGWQTDSRAVFEGDFCEACDMIHWPNAITDTPVTTLRRVAKYTSKLHPTKSKWHVKSYRSRLPGMLPRTIKARRDTFDLSLAEIGAEVDALTQSLSSQEEPATAEV